jgi:hypothetical protein
MFAVARSHVNHVSLSTSKGLTNLQNRQATILASLARLYSILVLIDAGLDCMVQSRIWG